MSDARPLWRGTLRLALVSCPVALLPTHHERNNLHFNMINPETGNRIRMMTVDAGTGEELERRSLVRGYEFRKDEYVLLTEEDFEEARIDSSSTLTIGKFVPEGSIGTLHFDNAYYLVPDGGEGQDVYAVLREALAQSRVLALSRLVLFRRERAVAILPLGKGLVLHTLHEEGDLNPAKEAFGDVPDDKPDAEMVGLARQLIDRQKARYDPADTEDRYEQRLRALIEAKVEGEDPPPPEDTPGRGGNVVDLMAALKQSLGGGALAKGRPAAKAPSGKAVPRKAQPGKAVVKKAAAGKAAARKEPALKTPGKKASGSATSVKPAARRPARKRA